MRADTLTRRAALVVGLLLLTSAAAAGDPAPARGLRAEIAALLMQGVPGGSLPIAVTVLPEPVTGDTEPVTGDTEPVTVGAEPAAGLAFLLEVPPAPPAAGGDDQRPLEVYAYAVNGAGEVVGHFELALEVWPSEGEGVKVAGRLEGAGEELSLRFLAWDPAARRYGLAVERRGAAAAPPPRVADDCGGWTVAGPDAARLGGFSARPVLVRGETQRLWIGRPPPPGGWRVRLEGGARGAPPAHRELAASATAPGELAFVAPDLPPGVYALSVAAADEPWSSAPLEIWLVESLPPVETGCRRSWSRVLRLARSGALAAEPGPARPAGAVAAEPAVEPPAEGLAAGYEAVLRRLAAAGDLPAAARGLAGLETEAAGAEITRTRPLLAAELGVARSLAAREPRCLLPLIALHGEVYRIHHGAGRFPLATHSRRLAAAIAELAVEATTDPAERRLVAVALTGLAEMVETRRASIEAQRLLEKALELDDERQAARLLLAVSYERKGRYEDARRQLEKLVSDNSAHFEARVRLAILLRRIGEPREAERLLRALVAERPPAWLLALGYQTLAQVLIREARLAEAVSVLERGCDRLPDDQPLRVLLAYARDRAGERRAAQEILAGLPPATAALTPRFRYSDEPAAALGLLRETLRQSVSVRLPVLAVALGGPGGAAPDRAPAAEPAGGPAG